MQTLKTAFNQAVLTYMPYTGCYWLLLLWLWSILADEHRRRQAIRACRPKRY